MRVSLVSAGGHEIASLDVLPSCRLRDVLSVVPLRDARERDCRRRIYFGAEELCADKTLEDIGVEDDSVLTLVVTQPFHVVCGRQDGSIVTICSAASGRCLHRLVGHMPISSASPFGVPHLGFGGIHSAVFSPCGSEVLTGSKDGTAKVWSVSSGECLQTLVGHEGNVYSASFSPDGQKIVTAAEDGTAKMWGAVGGECLGTLDGHDGIVRSAVYSPDGREVLTSSDDGTWRIWSADRGRYWYCRHRCAAHPAGVLSAVLSPGGHEVLTCGGADRAGRIWSAASGECLRTLEGHEDGVLCAVFSPDGREALTGSKDFTARIWCAASGECRRCICPERLGLVLCAAFSPDAQEVLVCHDNSAAHVWETATWERLCTLQGHVASFSPTPVPPPAQPPERLGLLEGRWADSKGRGATIQGNRLIWSDGRTWTLRAAEGDDDFDCSVVVEGRSYTARLAGDRGAQLHGAGPPRSGGGWSGTAGPRPSCGTGWQSPRRRAGYASAAGHDGAG